MGMSGTSASALWSPHRPGNKSDRKPRSWNDKNHTASPESRVQSPGSRVQSTARPTDSKCQLELRNTSGKDVGRSSCNVIPVLPTASGSGKAPPPMDDSCGQPLKPHPGPDPPGLKLTG
ncbi:hypothetical protein DPEC_G00028510 [Dallia pectoralis]|uniref:Uncharacterized protein n=1 Tax=Dallia pectoralis TaxID=75939 RepID=A0ACC2HI33_DALPE|nr:hypothetical protein DPEC_G00028510 [Dallia pectoralis]